MIIRNLYKITSVICVLLLAAATIFVLIKWPQVPDEIPLHYNFAGEADGYGGKGSLILLMVLAWVVFFTVTISIRFPEKWNLPVKVTEENRSRLYAIARAMMEVIKVLVTLLFILLFVCAATAAPVPQWIIIALTAAILLAAVGGIIMIYKHK